MITAVLAAATLTAVLVAEAPESSAASGSDFNPGFIISDEAFYDGSALSASQVQLFLDSKVSTCVVGYTCLKDYRQTTPTMPANSFCQEYAGVTNEPAASMIAKVGRACGVSPEVLLVLLQKEQSLVTHTWPSQFRFDKATGFACPDGAPCDPQYGSFFYQVYYAARQFQRYATYPTSYNYRAGRTNTIKYHPNDSCGTSSVYIANQATASLYNYTPYRPNRAALDNLYGSGDSCSSYGNRNFWRLFQDWFGDDYAIAYLEIGELQASMGGDGSALGTATTSMRQFSANGGGIIQGFQYGQIQWTEANGAVAVIGAMRDAYQANGGLGGSLGWPAAPAETTGAGQRQRFDLGWLYLDESGAGGIVRERMHAAYQANGAATGTLGFPQGAEDTAAGVPSQEFEGGTLVYVGTRTAIIGTDFVPGVAARNSVTGWIGWPKGPVKTLSGNGGGQFQEFDGAVLAWNGSGEVWTVNGDLKRAYLSYGGFNGALGWPRSNPITEKGTGLRKQVLQNGVLYVAGSRTGWVGTDFVDAVAARGGVTGWIGWPTAAPVRHDANGGGITQQYAGGLLTWNGSGEVWTVNGPVGEAYLARGGVDSALGWPRSNPITEKGTGLRKQVFQNGVLYVAGSRTGWVGTDFVDAVAARGGVTGWIGWPTAAPVRHDANGGGITQQYAGGLLTWNGSGEVWTVNGPVGEAYLARGGVDSALGWPVGNPGLDRTTGERWQRFQHGVLRWTASGGATVDAS